jgi:hypothetical protein
MITRLKKSKLFIWTARRYTSYMGCVDSAPHSFGDTSPFSVGSELLVLVLTLTGLTVSSNPTQCIVSSR